MNRRRFLRTVTAAGGSVAVTFSVLAGAARPIRELVIFRNNEVVHRVEPGRTEVEIAWTDESPPAPGAKPPWPFIRAFGSTEGSGRPPSEAGRRQGADGRRGSAGRPAAPLVLRPHPVHRR